MIGGLPLADMIVGLRTGRNIRDALDAPAGLPLLLPTIHSLLPTHCSIVRLM